jgi:hypothetical protein
VVLLLRFGVQQLNSEAGLVFVRIATSVQDTLVPFFCVRIADNQWTPTTNNDRSPHHDEEIRWLQIQRSR